MTFQNIFLKNDDSKKYSRKMWKCNDGTQSASALLSAETNKTKISREFESKKKQINETFHFFAFKNPKV